MDLYCTPEHAFYAITEELLLKKKIFNFVYRASVGKSHSVVVESILAKAFKYKKAWKQGKEVYWPEYLTYSTFPQMLYEDHGYSLDSMLDDERFYCPPTFSKKESTHSFAGRMSRPRDVEGSKYLGFLDYTLERWSKGGARNDYSRRSMPHFFFEIESPEWIYAELMKNPTMPRSGRTATTCVANIAFRWNTIEKKAILTIVLKHAQWSHLYGDFCGGANFLRAFERELGGFGSVPELVVMGISASLDEVKYAKEFLNTGSTYING